MTDSLLKGIDVRASTAFFTLLLSDAQCTLITHGSSLRLTGNQVDLVTRATPKSLPTDASLVLAFGLCLNGTATQLTDGATILVEGNIFDIQSAHSLAGLGVTAVQNTNAFEMASGSRIITRFSLSFRLATSCLLYSQLCATNLNIVAVSKAALNA